MGSGTWTFTAGVDFDVKAFSNQLEDRPEPAWHLRLLLPRVYWKHIAKAIAKRERAGLQRLELEDSSFDPGASPGRPMLAPKAAAQLWNALPDLEELVLVGHAWFPTLEHAGLKRLEMVGFGFTASFLKKPAQAPALETLVWSFSGDDHGVAPGASAFKGLWASDGLDSLRDLDLAGADIDGDLLRAPSFLKGKLLSQLDRLALPVVSSARDKLSKGLPKLTHLSWIGVSDPASDDLDDRIEVVPQAPPPLALSEADGVLRAFLINDANVERLIRALRDRAEYRGVHLISHDVSAGAEALGRALRELSTLERLMLGQPHIYGLKEPGLRGLAATLAGHPALRELNLRDNRLGGAVQPLLELVTGLPALETLNIAHGDLADGDLAAVVDGAAHWKAMRCLDISGNAKGEQVAPLANLTMPALERLDLRGTHALTPELVTQVLANLDTRLPRLRELGLAGAKLTTELAEAVGDALSNGALEALDVGLEQDIAPAIALIGERLPTLRRLAIEVWNHRAPVAGEEGGKLGAAIASLPALESLELDNIEFTADGLQAFADALGGSPSLTRVAGLDIDDVPEESTCDAIAGALKQSSIRTYDNVLTALARALLRADAVEDLRVADSYDLDEIVPSLPVGDAESLRVLRVAGGMLEPPVLDALANFCRSGLRCAVVDGAADAVAFSAFVQAVAKTSLEELQSHVPLHVAVAAGLRERFVGQAGPAIRL